MPVPYFIPNVCDLNPREQLTQDINQHVETKMAKIVICMHKDDKVKSNNVRPYLLCKILIMTYSPSSSIILAPCTNIIFASIDTHGKNETSLNDPCKKVKETNKYDIKNTQNRTYTYFMIIVCQDTQER